MAVTQFAFGVAAVDDKSTSASVFVAASATVEAETPSGSNAATTSSAPGSLGFRKPICRVATDTAVYISFGAAPDASSDTIRFYMPANSVEYFYVNPGDKAAVVTA